MCQPEAFRFSGAGLLARSQLKPEDAGKSIESSTRQATLTADEPKDARGGHAGLPGDLPDRAVILRDGGPQNVVRRPCHLDDSSTAEPAQCQLGTVQRNRESGIHQAFPVVGCSGQLKPEDDGDPRGGHKS